MVNILDRNPSKSVVFDRCWGMKTHTNDHAELKKSRTRKHKK